MFMKITFKTGITYVVSLALALAVGCTKEEDMSPAAALDQSAATALAAGASNPAVQMKKSHYILLGAANGLPADLKGKLQAIKGEVTGLMPEVGIATVRSDDPDFAGKAAKISGVGSVVRDLHIQWYAPEKMKQLEAGALSAGADAPNTNPPSSADNDPFFFLQWGHTAIQAPAAWNAGARGRGVKVAVLDGGFHLNHPDLKDNIIYSRSFVPGENAQMQGAGFSHGTHVAGTVAALDNNIGVIGVAPEAKLLLIKVLGDGGSGDFSWMLAGILDAVAQGADVINMSLGAYIPRNGKFVADDGSVINDTKAVQELVTAINKVTTYATQQGVTVISSAGNSAIDGNKDKSGMSIPSGAPNVISISATAPIGWYYAPLTVDLDRVASYTNFGTPDVSFAAPGGDFAYPGDELSALGIPVWALDMVLSTATPQGYSWSAGTSMASPHAAGVAALIIGRYGKIGPKQVEARLRASADDLGKPGRDPFYGHGRVNAHKAVGGPNL